MPSREDRKKLLDKGLCSMCGRYPHSPDTQRCALCVNYNRSKKSQRRDPVRVRKIRKNNREKGLCCCGREREDATKKQCYACNHKLHKQKAPNTIYEEKMRKILKEEAKIATFILN